MFKNPLLFPLKKVQKKVVKNERNPFLMTIGKTQFSVKKIISFLARKLKSVNWPKLKYSRLDFKLPKKRCQKNRSKTFSLFWKTFSPAFIAEVATSTVVWLSLSAKVKLLHPKNYLSSGNEFLLLLLLCWHRFHFQVWRLPSGGLLSSASKWPQAGSNLWGQQQDLSTFQGR